jgi:hypothetical protein
MKIQVSKTYIFFLLQVVAGLLDSCFESETKNGTMIQTLEVKQS